MWVSWRSNVSPKPTVLVRGAGAFKALLPKASWGGKKTLLLKPLTYMNISGQSVAEAVRFFKLDPSELVVLYDEIDLAPGKVRTKAGGGHSGHNGIRSIHSHIGPDYRRVRIGVGHPGQKEHVLGHVLGNFANDEQAWLDTLLDAISDAAPYLAEGADDKFQTRVALLTRPLDDTKPGEPSHGD